MPRTAPPEPAGPPPVAGAPPFGLHRLAGLPPEHRQAAIARLGAGNQQVARLITASAPLVARVGDGHEPPTLDEILDADRRIDLKTATDEQKLAEIRRQLDSQGIFSPTAHGAWEVWLSFGDRLREVATANAGLWERQVKETPALVATSPQIKKWRDALKLDVETEVRRTLASNKAFVVQEMTKLGLAGGPGGGPVAEATPENDAATAENQKALALAAKAMQAKALLLGIQLGAEPPVSKHSMPRIIYFRPKDKRDNPRWREAKEKWDLVQMFTAELMSRYPVVQSVISMHDAEGHDPENAAAAGKATSDLSQLSPENARKIMAIALKRSLTLIDNAEGLVGTDLDYRDFEPVHARLIALGAPATSGVDWSRPFERSILQKDVRQHGINRIAKSLGLGVLSAAAFIIAEFATAGMATFLFAGAGIGIGVGQAAASWDQYADLAKMHKAGTRPEHGLDLARAGRLGGVCRGPRHRLRLRRRRRRRRSAEQGRRRRARAHGSGRGGHAVRCGRRSEGGTERPERADRARPGGGRARRRGRRRRGRPLAGAARGARAQHGRSGARHAHRGGGQARPRRARRASTTSGPRSATSSGCGRRTRSAPPPRMTSCASRSTSSGWRRRSSAPAAGRG